MFFACPYNNTGFLKNQNNIFPRPKPILGRKLLVLMTKKRYFFLKNNDLNRKN